MSVAALGAALLIGAGLRAPPACAAYTITIQQVGTDVVATGAGSIDFEALPFWGHEIDQSLLQASGGAIIVGPTTPTDDTYYSGITGPDVTFGPGGEFFADLGSGAMVGLGTFDEVSGGVVAVPEDYTSGTPLGTSTATWANETIGSLGLTRGAFVWSWGSGSTADTFTIEIGAVGSGGGAVPELGTWVMMLLGLAGLALCGNAPPQSGCRVRRISRQFSSPRSTGNRAAGFGLRSTSIRRAFFR
jgi:hypothetical protein